MCCQLVKERLSHVAQRRDKYFMTDHQPFLTSQSLRVALRIIASIREVAAKEKIFRQGEPVRGVYLICSGSVALSIASSCQTRSAGPGSALGLPAAMGHFRYILTAQAVENAQVAFVPREQFMETLRRRPDLCLEVAQMIGTELHHVWHPILSLREDTVAIPPGVPCRTYTTATEKNTMMSGIGLERSRQLLIELKRAYSKLSGELQSVVRDQLTTLAEAFELRN